jgi:hypothetical protein
MALLSDLFGVNGQPVPQSFPQESPTDELMRRALQLNQNNPVISTPETIAAAPPGWAPTVEPAAPPPAPAPVQQPAAPIATAAAPPRPPVQMPQAAPSGMDRFSAFANGISRGGILTGIADAMGGVDRSMQTQNATASLLAQRLNLPAAQALAVARNPEMVQALLPNMFGKTDDSIVVNNRLVSKKDGRIIADFSDSAREGPKIDVMETPDGDKIYSYWDAKAGIRRNAMTNQPIAGSGGTPEPQSAGWQSPPAIGTPMPGTPAAQQSAIPPAPPGVNRREWRTTATKEMAEAAAKAKSAMPGVIRSAAQILQSIEAVENHPSLSRVTGPIDGRTPNYFGKSKDVEARIDELQGQTFLQAYETLKGAGAINVEEGKRATDALNRLKTVTVGDAEYRQALADFKAEVKGMLDTSRVKAGEMQQEHANARREARMALKKGAPIEAVKRRLMQNGIDPEGL